MTDLFPFQFYFNTADYVETKVSFGGYEVTIPELISLFNKIREDFRFRALGRNR